MPRERIGEQPRADLDVRAGFVELRLGDAMAGQGAETRTGARITFRDRLKT